MAVRVSGGRKFLALLLWLAPLSVLRGIVLAKLWEWFVADTFGVLAISVVQAVGLSTLVTYLGYAWSSSEEEPVAVTVSRSVTAAAICMFFGLVVVQFA